MSIEDARARLLAHMEIAQHRDRADLPWIVVSMFEGEMVNASGPYPTPEGALIAAQEEVDDERRIDPETGMSYHPIPLFPPRGEK